MNRKYELIKNTLIIALGSISVQFVSFLLLPFYTTHLSTADYGVVDLVNTYSFLLVPIISMQLSMAAFRFMIDARGDGQANKRIVSNVLAMALGSVSISALLFLLLTHFVRIQYADWGFATIATSIILGVLLQFARGFGSNSLYAIISVVTGVTALSLNILLIAFLHMGARGMLTSSIVSNVIGSLCLFFLLKLYRYIDVRAGSVKLHRDLLRYSLPLIPNGLSWWVIDTSDRTIISAVLGISANGIYAIAYKFPIVFTSLFSFFSMSWTESASLHIDREDRDAFFSEVCSASIKFWGAVAAVMVAYIALFFDVFIGRNFRPAYDYIPILVSASFFSSAVSLYSAIYISKKLTKQVANTSIFAAVINLVLSIISIKVIGMYGTAIATAVAYFVMAAYRHFDTKKYVKIVYEKNVFLKVTLLFAVATGLYYFNNPILNAVNVVAVSVAALVLNRSLVTVVRQGLLKGLQKLTPDQEVAEETM